MVALLKTNERILSLNARALQYTNHVNSKQAAQVANNKLTTKKKLQKAGLPTPRLFAIIKNRSELKKFKWTKLPPSFVVKPNNASGGGGIIVVFGRNRKGNWVKADRTEVFIPDLRHHILDIIDGNFSRNNVPDMAFFEQRVKNHSDLKKYCVKGIPDIRVLVYNYIPVMAELRLPTEESGGRANLHAGGIGAGIDLGTGQTTTAIHHGRLIDTLPNHPARLKLKDITIPYWSDILLTAVKTAQATDLGFAGVDIAIDRDDGPLVLEINARPGLAIQLANMAPLLTRLRRVEGLIIKKPERAVQLAVNLFSHDSEANAQPLSGRPVLGIEESVQIISADGHPHPALAKVDTGAYRTAIDKKLAKELGINKLVVDQKSFRAALGQETRPIVNASFQLRNQLIKTQVALTDRSHMNYPMIIGRRDLKNFLVDPAKTPTNKKP